MKKKVILGLFLASGLLFAKHQPKLSGFDIIALETSSPRVHVAKVHETVPVTARETKVIGSKGDYVMVNKTTMAAFVPVGK